MGLLSKIFKVQPKVDLGDLIQQGAAIIDVRTKQEFQQGHLKGAVNIPLDQLDKAISKLNKNKPVITCCASGMRSGVAKTRLRAEGFTVENGGSWLNLRKYFE